MCRLAVNTNELINVDDIIVGTARRFGTVRFSGQSGVLALSESIRLANLIRWVVERTRSHFLINLE